MTKVMLIDASHPEETRVAILHKGRLDDFDFETSTKTQTKGNIYLAKVVRVEPSLQAAFVDYGGNRDGFLAFSEIHPDYYRIPVADREAMQAANKVKVSDSQESADVSEGDASTPKAAEGDVPTAKASSEDSESSVDVIGGDDSDDLLRDRRKVSYKSYKIQDVIKRRQIMLVQVVKEERSSKGAALTTYLSLAGRYCVLMPNAERDGGVSRKITNSTDRKRLRSVIEGLEIPESMGVIVRTAGMERSKAEIKRDYEYLVRCWNDIRELTLQSTAPSLIYREGDLIKKAIRDLYSRDIEKIWVEGEEGYKISKNFMRMLMPSHSKRIHQYRNTGLSLFQSHNVESSIDEIHNPVVNLRSGGYIVINPTEALVAIDVNSGRSTRERNIEETALKTNLEAAEEIALQLRIRDLAGLIVIDFIDMDDARHNAIVEKRLKESMVNDRARIQIGHISHFGLLELSRQRLRPSILEVSSQVCQHCRGTGYVRSTESSALQVLRAIEEEGSKNPGVSFTIRVSSAVAFYLLNQKRDDLIATETRYGIKVMVSPDDTLIPPEFVVDKPPVKLKKDHRPERAVVSHVHPEVKQVVSEAETDETDETDENEEDEVDEEQDQELESNESGSPAVEGKDPAADPSSRRRRRSRRGGRRRGRRPDGQSTQAQADSEVSVSDDNTAKTDESGTETVFVTPDVPEQGEASSAGSEVSSSHIKSPASRSTDGRRRSSGRPVRGARAKVDMLPPQDQPIEGGTQPESSAEQPAVSPPALTLIENALVALPISSDATTLPKRPSAKRPSSKQVRRPSKGSEAASQDSKTEAQTVSGLAVSQAQVASLPPQSESSESPRRGWWQKLLD